MKGVREEFGGRCSDLAGVSCCHDPAFTIRSEGEACMNIINRQFGEIANNVIFRHAGCEIVENVGDCDAQISNAGFSASFFWVNRDVLEVVHARECIYMEGVSQMVSRYQGKEEV